MSQAMSIRTWDTLMRRKKWYLITIIVRGKEVKKEVSSEGEMKRWRNAFREQMTRKDETGVERVQVTSFYK